MDKLDKGNPRSRATSRAGAVYMTLFSARVDIMSSNFKLPGKIVDAVGNFVKHFIEMRALRSKS